MAMRDMRIEARAARLPKDTLATLVAQAYAAHPDMRRALEAAAAEHDPTPEWITAVLDSDLLEPVLLALDLWEAQAARVCKAWQRAWAATMRRRGGILTTTTKLFSRKDFTPKALCVAAEDSGELLCTATKYRDELNHRRLQIHVYDASMNELRSFLVPNEIARGQAINATVMITLTSVYVSCGFRIPDFIATDGEVDLTDVMYRLDVTSGALLGVHYHNDPIRMRLGPGGRLFALENGEENGSSKMMVFDALTLSKQHQFLLPETDAEKGDPYYSDFAVSEDAVFVVSPRMIPKDVIRVYSFGGDHLYNIQSPSPHRPPHWGRSSRPPTGLPDTWSHAFSICIAKDKIYLSELGESGHRSARQDRLHISRHSRGL